MKIQAEILAHSKNKYGDEVITFKVTFARIVLAEVLTHRMFARNTSSSRAIPAKKMREVIEENPFIPLAWQKNHKGMQGSEYLTGFDADQARVQWLEARDEVLYRCKVLSRTYNVTKQLTNRLLEPFMWTTMVITTTRQGLENFFVQRCPQYVFKDEDSGSIKTYNSKLEAIEGGINHNIEDTLFWLKHNESQAEIHIQALAESMYDAINESKAELLEENQWHIPYLKEIVELRNSENRNLTVEEMVKISVSMCARTSYTVIDMKKTTIDKHLELYQRLVDSRPIHYSPTEHQAKCMDEDKYYDFAKGSAIYGTHEHGWCLHLKGFIPQRFFLQLKN